MRRTRFSKYAYLLLYLRVLTEISTCTHESVYLVLTSIFTRTHEGVHAKRLTLQTYNLESMLLCGDMNKNGLGIGRTVDRNRRYVIRILYNLQ